MAFRYRCARPLKILSDAQIREIHQATLRVLQEVGVRFADSRTLAFLADHGCQVDPLGQIVRFPAGLVEHCLQQHPPEFRLRARNPQYDIVFDAHSVHFAACSGMEVLDLETLERRPGTLGDAEQAARLCDALDNMAGANTGLGHIADKPAEVNLEWLYATAIRNSEKVTSVAVMNDSERWGLKMARVAGEDIIVVPSSSSPLGWSAEQIRGMERALAADMPVGAQSMASPGVTAPATLVGTAVVMNAEILAMVALVQLLKPGTGMMVSCFTIPLDMRTTTLASGSIELGMLTAISAQLSKLYGMGSMVFLPMSDSKLLDQQAGFEKAMQWLLAGASGINLIWGAGMVEGHALWSNAQLVIDAEMCGMVGRYVEGVGVSDEALALDVVREVGHFPHSYLDTDHTYTWWRGERYLPLVSSREVYDVWAEMGRKDIVVRAAEKAEALLREHRPVPLDEDADRAIDGLLQAAAREKGVLPY
ncbi:MAG: trimethylamine methyltransferase family protein [Anaerolineae bacterium]|jgi:trimethylamine--corrinoid protein Co-methyltransferase